MADPPPRGPHHESRWGAAAAVLAVVVTQVFLPDSLTFHHQLVLPIIEMGLLVAVLTSNPDRLTAESRDMRTVSLALAVLIGLANAVSLGLLVKALLGGSETSGRTLILAALAIWLTNVVVFSLVYWEVDRRGPYARSTGQDVDPDLLFPQMTVDKPEYQRWSPAYADYLYVSFTNSTAFSPTDTLPLSRRIKLVMLAESLLSFVTVAIVGARAVNILR